LLGIEESDDGFPKAIRVPCLQDGHDRRRLGGDETYGGVGTLCKPSSAPVLTRLRDLPRRAHRDLPASSI
jgi:hypothetical protein